MGGAAGSYLSGPQRGTSGLQGVRTRSLATSGAVPGPKFNVAPMAKIYAR